MQTGIKAGVARSFFFYHSLKAAVWPSEQLPYAFGEQTACQVYCPSDCVISYLFTWVEAHFIAAIVVFLLPVPDSVICFSLDQM